MIKSVFASLTQKPPKTNKYTMNKLKTHYKLEKIKKHLCLGLSNLFTFLNNCLPDFQSPRSYGSGPNLYKDMKLCALGFYECVSLTYLYYKHEHNHYHIGF